MTARLRSVGLRARSSSERGQSIVEMAMILPLLMVVVLGVIEVSYAVLDHHVITKLTREGSNLISRDATLLDASLALRNMSTGAVNFSSRSRMIFSIVKRVNTAGAANFGKDILYARYEYGALAASSKLTTRGSGSFSGPPEYVATNSDNDTSLQLTNFPPNLVTPGGMLYVTEIYSRHDLITPFNQFGIVIPNILYSIAYF